MMSFKESKESLRPYQAKYNRNDPVPDTYLSYTDPYEA